ncbi:MAG: YdiU family protein [Rickettsiales bacterium]|jgi:serine/tyrosine/threonine adenylyltransferase|nr:YdiU family protein [Rickettsiales bacterium]
MQLDNSYQALPEDFYKAQLPDHIKTPRLRVFNKKLAQTLNLPLDLSEAGLAEIFSGNKLLKGSKPIALAYAGHQFGHFSPSLGDGRAVLLGEVLDKKKQKFDLQLKGSGPTFFARRGDGRYPLGPAIREYIISEAMHHLRVPTTRSLALITTGEFVQRETLMPGAILTRVAESHIRIGTFEYFSARGDYKNLKILADYAIDRHYPICKNQKAPYLSLFRKVLQNQAKLVSSWLSIGFIHGVMNTDNTAISGQTLDYGPCAFIDEYQRDASFSFIDKAKRYSFTNQRDIILWNLAKLAEALLPLIDNDTKQAIAIVTKELNSFNKYFDQCYSKKMSQKIGLFDTQENDAELISEFLQILENNQADFTINFRSLSTALETGEHLMKNSEYEHWVKKWKKRIIQQTLSVDVIINKMNKINPLYIPRNHITQDIIQKSLETNNFNDMQNFLKILKNPFKEQANSKYYQTPPNQSQKVQHTFCGT